MAANQGVGTFYFVLLLCCWHEVKTWHIRRNAGSNFEQPSTFKNLDNNITTVFDEILAQEILHPNNPTFFEKQKPLTTPPGTTNKKKEEAETMYQIKSLGATEKIIHNLRRSLGESLKRKRRLHKSMLTASYYKEKPSLD
nr:sperm acrosome-associated protein 7-like [Microcebus murinus]